MLWYDKYAPKTLDGYVWTDDTLEHKISNWISNPLSNPSIILQGSTGTGKTTLATIIRDTIGEVSDSKFIPASLRSGVDTIREEIVGFCEAGGFNDLKLIILDEADRLSKDAQQMLRNVMDRYSEDVRFIFTCNYPEKIIDALKSRVWEITINDLDKDQFEMRLLNILDKEMVTSTDASLRRIDTIINTTYPNMRKAINELQWAVVDGVLQEESVTEITSWDEQLLGLCVDFNIDNTRKFVAAMQPHQYETAYKTLYQNSFIFENVEKDAILIIAEFLYKNSQAGLPDITLCACIISLAQLL